MVVYAPADFFQNSAFKNGKELYTSKVKTGDNYISVALSDAIFTRFLQSIAENRIDLNLYPFMRLIY
jgi:hypothetical protein